MTVIVVRYRARVLARIDRSAAAAARSVGVARMMSNGALSAILAPACSRHAAQRHLRDRSADRRRRHGRDLQGPRDPDRRSGRDQDDAAGTCRERGGARAVPQGSLGAAPSASRSDRPLLRLHGRAGAAAALSGDGIRRRPLALRHPAARTADVRGGALADAAGRRRPAGRARARHHPSRRVARQHHRSRAATSRAPRSSISASRARRSSATAP